MEIPALSRWARKDQTNSCRSIWTNNAFYPIMAGDHKLGEVAFTARVSSTRGLVSNLTSIDVLPEVYGTLDEGQMSGPSGESLDQRPKYSSKYLPRPIAFGHDTVPEDRIPKAAKPLYEKFVSVMTEMDIEERDSSPTHQLLKEVFQGRLSKADRDTLIAKWEIEWEKPIDLAARILNGTLYPSENPIRKVTAK